MIDMQDMLSKIKNKFNNDFLEELAISSYKEDRNYPENFSNWYPLIKDTGYFKTANIINNQIFSFEEVEIMQETDNIDKVNWDKINKILKPTLDKLENNKLYSNSLVDLEKSYMEVKITFTSGDIIEIVCEYIEFEEDDL